VRAADYHKFVSRQQYRDALNATKAAVAEGIVPGGGTALLYASQDLDPEKLPGVDPHNMDQKTGAKIIKNALMVPIKAIANNAGTDGAVVVGKLLDINDREVGYNAQTGIFLFIFDPSILLWQLLIPLAFLLNRGNSVITKSE
jgi:chaperonin GroEL